mgnify:CR=1 FL=1
MGAKFTIVLDTDDPQGLREVAKKVEEGKMDSSLRDSKRFIDGKWELLIHNS